LFASGAGPRPGAASQAASGLDHIRYIELIPFINAVVLSTYGPPDVIQIHDVEKPLPNDHEVLIKIHAASVNPLDRTGCVASPISTAC